MTDVRRALVLAAGSLAASAADDAFATVNYSATKIDASRLFGEGGEQDVAAALEQVDGEFDALVVGDSIFPGSASGDDSLRAGLRATFLSTKLVMRGMLRHRFGRIIAVAPLQNCSQVPHAAAVDGLGGFVKSVAREVGSRGITANVVAIGSDTADPDQLSPYLAVPRAVAEGDVVSALSFLLADDSSYFTGHVLWVDGGLGLA